MGAIEDALETAQRILREAEIDPDLVRQSQLSTIAGQWIDVANAMIEASRV